MSDCISIQRVRDELDFPRNRQHRDLLLALVEAVEAAHEVAGAPFGQIEPRDFYRLRESLARFDFGEQA